MIDPSGSFDRRFLESNSFEENLAELKTLIGRIEELGVPVLASSRLPGYVREAERIRTAVLKNRLSPRLSPSLVHQAFLETADLTIVVEQLSQEPQPVGWKEKLQIAVGGRELPQSEL